MTAFNWAQLAVLAVVAVVFVVVLIDEIGNIAADLRSQRRRQGP